MDKEVSIATPDIKTDIRWLFQKKDGIAHWQSIPFLWISKDAYLIKDHPTIALFLARVIFDIFEAERREALSHLNKSAKEKGDHTIEIIKKRYDMAESLSRKLAKSFAKSDIDDVISTLQALQEKLDTKYLLPDSNALYKFNAHSSIYSMADIHYIIGNTEKAVSEYQIMLQNVEIKKPQKATIFFNLSLLYCKIGEFEKSEMFYNNYLKLEHEIGTIVEMNWHCEQKLK